MPYQPPEVAVKLWMMRHSITNFSTNEDNTIDIGESLRLFIQNTNPLIDELPISIRNVRGDMYAGAIGLRTFKNFPKRIDGSCSVTSNPSLNSLEYAPRYIGGNFNISGTSIDNLHNIHKHIDFIKHMFTIGSQVKSNILGCLLLDGPDLVSVADHTSREKASSPLGRAVQILNNHLGKCNGRDIILCQEEMLDAGLAEFARL